mmetsp:Transcript_57234/g.135188  ORF Transcript_57234/g.135188 Transcript_57234/m.135188 type:complete len:266 (-) Transcript_57234:2511-3308(-)
MVISSACSSRAASASPCGSASITASAATASMTSASSPRDFATLRSASTAENGPVMAGEEEDVSCACASSASAGERPMMPNWRAPKRRYTPSRDRRSSCVPDSTIFPPCTTEMMSALRIVDRRCATTTHVRPTMSRSSASCTSFSLSASSDDVASSSSRIAGFLIIARAIATRCFCPPESWPPLDPTSVSNPSGNSMMKLYALAILAASSTSARVAPALPLAMLSAIVPANSTGSCPTRPICSRNHLTLSSLRSTPSSLTMPESGS